MVQAGIGQVVCWFCLCPGRGTALSYIHWSASPPSLGSSMEAELLERSTDRQRLSPVSEPELVAILFNPSPAILLAWKWTVGPPGGAHSISIAWHCQKLNSLLLVVPFELCDDQVYQDCLSIHGSQYFLQQLVRMDCFGLVWQGRAVLTKQHF